MKRLRFAVASALVAAVLAASPWIGPRGVVRGAALPEKLSDREYWALIDDSSEPNGYFQSDNIVGNERFLQYVVPALKKLPRGGVYLGVAPDQNFTYIAALEPKMAFIVDIRRGNLQEHLMYKALFEMSADRADFVSRLFSKKRPAGLTASSTASELMNAFWNVETDEAAYKANLLAIEDWLVKKHGFALTPDDLKGLEYVYGAFYWFGPSITYQSSTANGRGGGNMPSYADLLSATDGAGDSRSYLANEESFKFMKTLEEKNLLVPVVGDFAGPKALRAVGRYIADHGATVTAFYTSNVEQYLFRNGVWREFYTNVGALPLDEGSTFIRSASGANLLDPIRGLLKDFNEGRVQTYNDVTIRGSR